MNSPYSSNSNSNSFSSSDIVWLMVWVISNLSILSPLVLREPLLFTSFSTPSLPNLLFPQLIFFLTHSIRRKKTTVITTNFHLSLVYFTPEVRLWCKDLIPSRLSQEALRGEFKDKETEGNKECKNDQATQFKQESLNPARLRHLLHPRNGRMKKLGYWRNNSHLQSVKSVPLFPRGPLSSKLSSCITLVTRMDPPIIPFTNFCLSTCASLSR